MNAFICSMYNEFNNVLGSIKEISSKFPDGLIILVVSDNGNNKEFLKTIEQLCNKVIVLEDLSGKYNPWELPSRCLARNYSKAFNVLYETIENKPIPDYIVCFNGDTVVSDASNFDRIIKKMRTGKKVAAISQAIGQNFHSDDSDPANGICGGRFQSLDVADFAPCLWVLDGEFAAINKAYTDIEVTNRYASEQCLGDELIKHLPDWKNKILRLNEDNINYSYAYSDGILYHQHEGK